MNLVSYSSLIVATSRTISKLIQGWTGPILRNIAELIEKWKVEITHMIKNIVLILMKLYFFLPGERCEAVDVESCKDLDYTQTVFPNALGLKSVAGQYWNQLKLLGTSVRCSEYLPIFGCSAIYPRCIEGTSSQPLRVIGPCRSLCQRRRTDTFIFCVLF